MIYITEHTSAKQKQALSGCKNIRPYPEDRVYQRETCMMIDNKETLYYLYPSENPPLSEKATDNTGYYEYHKNKNTYQDGGEIDIIQGILDKHMWDCLETQPVVIITDIDLDEPEDPSNEIECYYPEVYKVLTDMGFFHTNDKESDNTEEIQKATENLTDTLDKIISSILTGEEEKHAKAAKFITNKLKRSPYELNKPEVFHTMAIFPLNMMLEQVAAQFHEPAQIKDKYKASFIYLHYDFMEHNIETLLKTITKTSCCITDKSRFLLEQFLKYSITGDVPDFKPDPKHYEIPKFGTPSEWMDYCDGVYYLYHGRLTQYLTAYQCLIDAANTSKGDNNHD